MNIAEILHGTVYHDETEKMMPNNFCYSIGKKTDLEDI
jgi:hypothetical protein